MALRCELEMQVPRHRPQLLPEMLADLVASLGRKWTGLVGACQKGSVVKPDEGGPSATVDGWLSGSGLQKV